MRPKVSTAPGTKFCTTCHQTLPLEAFGAWRAPICKPCESARARAYYLRNREQIKARTRRTSVENPERTRAYKRKWYEAHKPEMDAASRAWRETHPDERRAVSRRYAAAHRETVRVVLQAYRARKRRNYVEPVNLDEIYERDGGICQICRLAVSRKLSSMDHIIPLVDGGAHARWNVQLTHLRCNLRRNRGYIPAQTRLPM